MPYNEPVRTLRYRNALKAYNPHYYADGTRVSALNPVQVWSISRRSRHSRFLSQTTKELAKSTPVLRDPNLRRIVIASSPDIYGMMRMFEIEGEEKRPNFHVVRTQREAWGILAVQKPRFTPLN